MIFFGLLSFALNIYPVKYLQALVVFSTSTIAATLVGAGNDGGVLAAGDGARRDRGDVRRLGDDALALRHRMGERILRLRSGVGAGHGVCAYYFLGLEPIVWGMLASCLAGVIVSLATQPPDQRLVSWLFDRQDDQPATA